MACSCGFLAQMHLRIVFYVCRCNLVARRRAGAAAQRVQQQQQQPAASNLQVKPK